jgi:hypothetical protein
MRIIATPRTAALTGLWTVVGELLLDHWEEAHPRSTHAYGYASGIVMIFFFFIPVVFFVVGPSYIKLVQQTAVVSWQSAAGSLWANRRPLWRDVFRPVYFRMLWWFLAGGIATLTYSAVRHFWR